MATVVITNTSPFTGKVNEMELPMSTSEYQKAYIKWQAGAFIQDAFPNLTAEQREFIKTGITPEEWDTML